MTISIIDYGFGNISAIANLAKLSQVPFEIIKTPDEIASASRILLPGVGAFDQAMGAFRASGLADALIARSAVPDVCTLGICVGMHVLANGSDEGTSAGLGLIPGRVRRFDPELLPKPRLPHMGWNSIEGGEDSALLAGIDRAHGFYFLHSYYYQCDSQDSVVATATHGRPFHAVVRAGNVYGVQFHPEKSHDNGLRLIRNFAELAAC